MATLTPYHPHLRALLETFPAPGRFHTWLFKVALHMRHYHSQAWTFALLRECADDMDRQVPEDEIQKAVAKAYDLDEESFRQETAPDWMPPNPARIAWAQSTTKPLFSMSATNHTARDVLPALFDPGELICSAPHSHAPVTESLESLLEAPEIRQYIVPNPMTAIIGTNSCGKPSARCLDNTGPRRYLVIESDTLDKPAQVAILSHLAAIAPLVLVVDTAGKSLHGWFHLAGASDYQSRLFMQYACTLGADPHTWTRCQWVRMPGGTRYAEGRQIRQPILFFNPEVLSCPEL